MAYFNQEKKATVNAALKPILKRFGLKGSLSVRNHSTVSLTIKSGKIDFIGNYNATQAKRVCPEYQRHQATNYVDVNVYWYKEHFSGVAQQAIGEIITALKSADWYDESDAQTDYFNTAYYVDVKVGKYAKPYELV